MEMLILRTIALQYSFYSTNKEIKRIWHYFAVLMEMGGGIKLTAQYKVVISGASQADITILATGQTTTIQHRSASSQTFTVGGLKVRYQNSDPFFWIFTDANGAYLAWRTADSEEATFTKEWDNTYTNTGTFYFYDSIKQPPQSTMTIPS